MKKLMSLIVALAGMVLIAAVSCQDQCDPSPNEANSPTESVPVVEPEDDVSLDPKAAAPPTASLDDDLVPIFDMISRNLLATARDRAAAYLEQNPESGQGEFLLGLTYHREKRYALARPHFAKAVQLSPNFHPAHHFFGWCLYYLGQSNEARSTFQEHVRLVPDHADSHFALGLLAMEDDRLDDAERRFTRAIELQKDNPARKREVAKAHARLGDLYMRQDRLDAAKTQLETAINLWPQHYAAYYKLHLVLNRLDEPEAAQRAFQQYRLWQEQAERRRGLPGQGR